ncbi:hypothetical protein [Pseudomonas graminis]|uniref:hypothetical protein n=1 Tax=Pseudomonas graminis TaxID=158627 RepID=UPI003C130770
MAQDVQNRREALAQLAQSAETRSYTAQIRELYDAIESALDSGVSRTVIHQTLVDTGMTITLRHFDQALYRIRKGLKRAGQRGQSSSDKSPVSTPAKNKLLSGEKTKPPANFRQGLKQIRDEVENTDWARVISESDRCAQ